MEKVITWPINSPRAYLYLTDDGVGRGADIDGLMQERRNPNALAMSNGVM